MSKRQPLLAMLVEDDPTTAEIMQSILKMERWEVVSARSVEFALRALNYQPTVVVLDLRLSGEDGSEVLKKIRADNLPTRVVVVSGVEDRETLEKVETLNPDLLLHKPLQISELIRFLEEVRQEVVDGPSSV
jgi:DNA-binding response OmpR family regulator